MWLIVSKLGNAEEECFKCESAEARISFVVFEQSQQAWEGARDEWAESGMRLVGEKGRSSLGWGWGAAWIKQSGIILSVIRKALRRSEQGTWQILCDMKCSAHVPYHYTVSNYRGGSVGPWIPLLLQGEASYLSPNSTCADQRPRDKEHSHQDAQHVSSCYW